MPGRFRIDRGGIVWSMSMLIIATGQEPEKQSRREGGEIAEAAVARSRRLALLTAASKGWRYNRRPMPQ
jgi:hypothetical protein